MAKKDKQDTLSEFAGQVGRTIEQVFDDAVASAQRRGQRIKHSAKNAALAKYRRKKEIPAWVGQHMKEERKRRKETPDRLAA